MQTTIEEAGATWIGASLKDKDLDYTVALEPLAFEGINERDYFWSYRVWPDGTREAIAPVGKDFRPLQNWRAFDFLNKLVPAGDLVVDEYKDYRQGVALILRAHIPGDYVIVGEPVKQAIYFINGHNGHTPIGGCYAPERLACANQLVFRFRRNEGPAHSFKIRHTSLAVSRLDAALTAMSESREYFTELRAMGERLAAQRIKTRDFERILKRIVPIPEDVGRGQTLALARADEIRNLWRESDNLENIRFTKWGALNAVVEWNDHNRQYADENVRFDAMFRGRNLYRATLNALEPRQRRSRRF